MRFRSENRRHRGSALVMGIVISVVITGLILAISWTAGTQAQATANLSKIDAAFFAAEAGAQRVAWYCKKGQMGTITSPLTGTVNGYAYSSSWTTVSGSTIRITSTGSLGAVSYTMYVTAAPGSAAAAIASAGNFSTTSLLTLTGNVSIVGNISSSGTANVTGNVNATGSIDSGLTVSGGTATPNDSSVPAPPSVSAIYTSQSASAYSIPSGSIITLDFTGHPVLVANGNVTLNLASVTGTGTLLVNGTCSTGSDVGTVGSPLHFNIVSTSDFTATNKFYLVGSVYSGGKVTFNNLTDLTGVLVATQKITLNNHHAFTFATPPSFDPRSGTLLFTSFAGPTQ